MTDLKTATKKTKKKETKAKAKPKDKKVYLKNKDLYNEIIKSKEQDELTPRAQEMFILLTNKVSLKMKYRDPQDREDCISSAYLDLIRYWRAFNPEKSTNAFAYYTEIIKKGFAKGWNALHPKKYQGTLSIDKTQDYEGIYSI